MKTLSGKNIWIIGASSGIGEALAIELSNQGASLALSARNEDKLNQLNNKLGKNHHVLPVDVSKSQTLIEAANTLYSTVSKLDSVIFMAAIYAPPTRLHNLDIETTHKIVDTNLNGAFNTIHAVLPILMKQGEGQLVICGSVAGYRGLPEGQPYSATKAALINLTETLKAEQQNLDIKLISPGFVKTPMTDKNTFDMPMIIEPEEAAKAIAKGLCTKAFEIHFPKKFTLLMKTLWFLPSPLYNWFAKRIANQS